MTIKVGDKLPAGAFKTKTADGPKEISSDALFAGKTVVLFSVPGAFTPTCDAKHLPGYIEHIAAFRAKGDLDNAVKDFDLAIKVNPNDPQTYYNRGSALADKGEADRAVADHAAEVAHGGESRTTARPGAEVPERVSAR